MPQFTWNLPPRSLVCYDCRDLLDPWEKDYCCVCFAERMAAQKPLPVDLRAFEIPVDNRRLRS